MRGSFGAMLSAYTRGVQLRDADHVETVLMIGQGLALELMRDSFIQRILLRWRLFANRESQTQLAGHEDDGLRQDVLAILEALGEGSALGAPGARLRGGCHVWESSGGRVDEKVAG
jgi:hypothetical protein